MIKVHPFGSDDAVSSDYFGGMIEKIEAVNKGGNLASVKRC